MEALIADQDIWYGGSMIYLIGGPPRCGKTTLASIILERKGVSCISTDVIRNLLDFSPTKLGFLQLEEDKRPEAFFPYFLQFLKILQNRYPHYVVEGDIFTPEQIASLQEKITLKCCFLGMSEVTVEDLKKTHPRLDWIGKLPPDEKVKLTKSITEGNWVNRLSPEEQEKVPQQLMDTSNWFKAESVKYHFSYFDIYPDQDKALEAAYTALI